MIHNDYRDQPKAGTGHKMLSVPFVFSMSHFQGPAFRCDKIVVIVTLLEAIEGIPVKDNNFTRDYFMGENSRVDIQRDVFTNDHFRVNLLSRIKANISQNYFYINLL